MNFNPRVPCGTRLFSEDTQNELKEFQSAGPVWDPTKTCRLDSLSLDISIRGSRVGPDHPPMCSMFTVQISIRGSRVGPDMCHNLLGILQYNISIRGSRVGPDTIYFPMRIPPTKNFNPRVPCGTRLVLSWFKLKTELFQSAGPVWDPTRRFICIISQFTISIRGSRVGPDGGEGVAHFDDILISIRGSRVGPDPRP